MAGKRFRLHELCAGGESRLTGEARASAADVNDRESEPQIADAYTEI